MPFSGLELISTQKVFFGNIGFIFINVKELSPDAWVSLSYEVSLSCETAVDVIDEYQQEEEVK